MSDISDIKIFYLFMPRRLKKSFPFAGIWHFFPQDFERVQYDEKKYPNKQLFCYTIISLSTFGKVKFNSMMQHVSFSGIQKIGL